MRRFGEAGNFPDKGLRKVAMKFTLAIAGLILAVFCLPAHAGSKAFSDGQEEARKDINSGAAKYLLYGEPMLSDRFLAEVLKKDYGVTLVVVGGCTVSAEARERADGYNKVMQEHLKVKSRKDIIAEAEAKARKLLKQENAKTEVVAKPGEVSPGR